MRYSLDERVSDSFHAAVGIVVFVACSLVGGGLILLGVGLVGWAWRLLS